jgi:Fur family ferric uptake transcriptional regulator
MITRHTKQKEAIASALKKKQQPLTIEEIHRMALSKVPSLGIATVYRTLKSLLEEGKIKLVQLPGQPLHYEEAHKGHHHHFCCTTCHGVFELEKCPKDIHQLAPRGFQVSDHEIILYGLCTQCTVS